MTPPNRRLLQLQPAHLRGPAAAWLCSRRQLAAALIGWCGLLAVSGGAALAGEHVMIQSTPDAVPEPVFMSTVSERQRDGVTIVLRDHDSQADTVLIAAWPAFGFTVCDRQPLRLYSARAEVLEVPAADGHMACLGRIPARWVRETVIARIPMFNAGARAAQLDTSGLQLDRLRQVRP
ncbi:MAG: hypothetical protein WCT47_03675 [Betaproteobacteria bacterium]|jgi:hypothetical protein